MALNHPLQPSTRRRVLVSAYACGPTDGPEGRAGWAFAVAASQHNDVWVVTRRRFEPSIRAALAADEELSRHLTVEYLDLPAPVMRLKRRSWDLYWYYVLWQWSLLRRARRMHATLGFDVAHHVTFANDWLPCGISRLGLPFVWGPVGGASRVPAWRVRRWLGPRGVVTELVRASVTGAMRMAFGDPAARRAAVVVAQNPAVGHRFRWARRVVVEPNAALEPLAALVGAPTSVPRRPATGESTRPTAVFVGRLTGWKGCRLALAAVAHPLASRWQLKVYGDGHDRRALERLAVELGVSDRVEFMGHRPRAEVLGAFRCAAALLFPSFHDQAGWVVAEASSVGCPVVCLPLGGPPTLAGPNGRVARLEGDVVENLARELLAAAAEGRGVVHERWSADRLPGLVDDWYDDVVTASGGGRRWGPGT